MSEFSKVLRSYIQKKKIQIYSMAQYCHMDRSTMYKIINGKRNPPSEEHFKRMCDFMHLAPAEYDVLRQAYETTLLGETVYLRRKSVEKFIKEYQNHSQMSAVPPLPMVSAGTDVEKWKRMQPCMALSSQLELSHFLQYMLISEANKKEGQIGLFLQPDNDFLFGLLAGLRSAGNLKIQQIICLDGDEEDVTTNISYLNYVLPLYLYLQQYDLYYYYDDIHAHYHSFNGVPCMILTSDCAITCTSDLGMGIMYHDIKVVSMLWELFHMYQGKCTQLFQPVCSVLKEGNIPGSMGWDKSPGFVIQPEPCLLPYISPDMLEKIIYQDIQDRTLLLSVLQEFITTCRGRFLNKNMHLYHTKQGIQRFAETGRLQEIPEEICRPFTVEERIRLLHSMLQQCDFIYCRLLKKPLEHIPGNLHICVNSAAGYLLDTNGYHQNIYLVFEESSFLIAFLDYASSLSDKELYTGKETREYIENVMKGLNGGTINETN